MVIPGAIYNQPSSLPDEDHTGSGIPWLVAEDDGSVGPAMGKPGEPIAAEPSILTR